MEAVSFSSLKDLLNIPSNNEKPFSFLYKTSSSWAHNEFLKSPKEEVAAMATTTVVDAETDGVMSSRHSLSLSPSTPSLSSMANVCYGNKLALEKKLLSSAGKESLDKEFLSKGRVFPPPITCLRNCKKGKPFAYLRYNESDGTFVVEEIRIPQCQILRASRSDGRLKLYFADDDDDDEYEADDDDEYEADDEDEKEMNKENGQEEEKKGDEEEEEI